MRKRSIMLVLLTMGSTSCFSQGLKDAYEGLFTIGVSVNQRNVTDSAQMALICANYNSITAENAMKPASTEPQEGVYDWRAADRIADFCRKNGIRMRGHCLVWHNQIGKWMYQDEEGNPLPKDQFLHRMRAHIHAIVSRYKDVVYCWDVVNEAITDNPHTSNPYRESPLYRIAGDEFIAAAFRYAREADPAALLFYNDYNECDPVKSRRIYEMVLRMRADGVPIDGIGMQGHYNVYHPRPQDIDHTITLFRRLVSHIHVTELDVRASREQGGGLRFSTEGEAPSDTLDQLLADQYARIFTVLRRHSDVIDNVTFWNLSDRDSWLGARNYPLPFDVNYQPKTAYKAIMQKKEVGE